MSALLGLVILILCLSPTNYVKAYTGDDGSTCNIDDCKKQAKKDNYDGDVGCIYQESQGVKFDYQCKACNVSADAKKNGYQYEKGCEAEGLSTILILVIVGVALLVTVGIILALCCLVPSCPLAKMRINQGRQGGRGTGGGQGRGGGATPSRNASKNTSRANLNSGGGNNRSRPPTNRASPSASRQSRKM